MERKRHLKIGISSYTDTHTVLGVTGNAEFSGIVTALEFHGDGSNLTNITADAGAYAGTSGFATVAGYAHTAGIATVAEGLTGRPDIEINNLDVAGLSTFTGDVSFGSTATFGDNDKLKFGDDDDLEIFHNSSNGNTIIQETTGGNLVIKGSNLFLQSASGEDFFKGDADGAVELYYDDTKKFETTGAGVTVTGTTFSNQLNVSGLSTFNGDVQLGVNDRLKFGNSSDLQIYHDGFDSHLADSGSGGGTFYLETILGNKIEIRKSFGNVKMAVFTPDSSVDLYYNNSKKFETTGVGVTVFGTTQTQQLNVSGLSTFNDDVKVYGSNLNVYSGYGQFGNVQIGAGNNRTIRTSTGNLILESNWNQVEILDDVIVSGIVTANGFVGPLEGNVTGDLTGDVNAGVITAVSGNFTGNVTIGGTLTYEDVTNVDSIGIVTARDGIVVNTRGIHVLSGITTLQDLDAQDLNIRNITGSAATFTDSVSLYDNDKIFLGTSQEMEIFHGTLGNSFFTSTKPLYIKYGAAGQTHEMFIQNDSTTAAKFTDDASVELYYNGGKRLETVGGGVTVTGDLRVSGVVTAARFESTSSGTPSIDSPNNLDLNAINVAVSTDMSVGRNLTVVGFVSAANFYGDGSGLTNLPSQSYVGNAGVATYAQTAGIATLAENLTGSPAITISSATVGSTLTIQSSNIYRSNADLTLTGGGPQSTRSQLVLSNGSSATLKANDDSGSVVLKAPVGSVQVLDVGVTTSTPFLRTGAAGTVRLDRGDGNFTGVVTATTFYGDFQGSGSGITGITATYADSAGIATYASTAGVSTSVTLVASNTATGFHYLTFVDTATGNENLRTDTSLRYVPETGELNITGGNLTANSATLGSINASGVASIGYLNVSGVTTFQSSVNLGELDRINFYTTNTTIYGDSSGLNIEASGTNDVTIQSNASGGNSGDVKLRTVQGGRVELIGTGGVGIYHTHTALKLETTGVGATVFGTLQSQQLNVSGVSTFNDNVSIASSVLIGDNNKVMFGDDNDIEQFFNGTSFKIQPKTSTTTSQLDFEAKDQVYLHSIDNGVFLRSKNQSVIDLYGGYGGGIYFKNNGTSYLKLEYGNWTTQNNADWNFIGTNYDIRFDASDGALEFEDNAEAIFGNNSDLRIKHDGTDNHITSYDKDLNIELNPDISTPKIYIRPNISHQGITLGGGSGNPVELYHNNNKIFETTGAGVTVFGTTESQQLNVTGILTATEAVIGTIAPASSFTTINDGGVKVVGVLTATTYYGDGSQLTGVLAASEAGISIQDDQSAVGVSTTIDFGTGLSVSPVSAGVVTVTSAASAGISPVIAGMIF